MRYKSSQVHDAYNDTFDQRYAGYRKCMTFKPTSLKEHNIPFLMPHLSAPA